MKPLDLVHYRRPHPGEDGFWEYRARLIAGRSKRLTDAELAAEYHASAHEFDMDWAQTGENNRALNERTDALFRFAYFPHYDEAES